MATSVPLQVHLKRTLVENREDLMYDALILAKQQVCGSRALSFATWRQDFDVFNALDIMENDSFLKEMR